MTLEEEAFRLPPTEFRGGPFWVWNDTMEREYLTEQIDTMAEEGWGAFFMHSRYGLAVDYLSEEWMNKIRHSVETASSAGIDPWLYDENLWPSGYANGDIPAKGADYRIKALVLRDTPEPCEDVHRPLRFLAADHVTLCRHLHRSSRRLV